MSSVVLAVLFFSLYLFNVLALTCLDNYGNTVDWWVSLKHSNDFNYTVYNNKTGAFDIEEHFVVRGGHLSNTLQALYGSASSYSYLFANDETPDMVEKDQAHQKVCCVEQTTMSNICSRNNFDTVIGIGATTGFWLIHSVPRFPVDIATYNKNGYIYPDEEKKYGQTFMCLTLSVDSFETVMQAFYIDNPQVYDSQLLSNIANRVPTMQKVINNEHQLASSAQTFSVSTVGGKQFTIFAKNKKWGKELYEDFVAPTLNDGLLVESWMNGVGKIGSTCKPYKVLDITEVQLPDGASWKETGDHSKWAIAANSPWSCVGDINRQHGQMVRGGGTYCTKDKMLWGAFSAIVSSVNKTCS